MEPQAHCISLEQRLLHAESEITILRDIQSQNLEQIRRLETVCAWLSAQVEELGRQIGLNAPVAAAAASTSNCRSSDFVAGCPGRPLTPGYENCSVPYGISLPSNFDCHDSQFEEIITFNNSLDRSFVLESNPTVDTSTEWNWDPPVSTFENSNYSQANLCDFPLNATYSVDLTSYGDSSEHLDACHPSSTARRPDSKIELGSSLCDDSVKEITESHPYPTLPIYKEVVIHMNSETGFKTSPPRWRLDEYILSLSTLLRQTKLVNRNTVEPIITAGILWVVREAWPAAEAYWKMTASFTGFLQCEIWRNFPCQKTYAMLHPAYRPTELQLAVAHSPIIDWLPWPDLRDRVILFQDQIDVDLVCKTAIENVVSHRRYSSSCKSSNQISSFRVWDLCLLEQQNVSIPNKTLSLSYKPKSAAVLALEKAYGLSYDDFTTQKLHPDFFEKYPFLYCESAVSRFRVQDMQTVTHEDVGCPKKLGLEAVHRLKAYLGEIGC